MSRLHAVDALWRARGGRMTALETAALDSTYAWDEQIDVPFERVQALPDRSLASATPREVFSAVTQALDRLDPDAVAVNSYSGWDAQAALLWCRRRRRVAVMMSNSKADDYSRSWWREALKRRIVAQFDAGLVAGSRSRSYYVGLGMDDAALFETCNTVDNSRFAAIPPPRPGLPGLNSGAPFFLVVSRLLRVKNLDALLHAYGAYRDAVPDPWGLVIVGDGHERERLEAVARQAAGDAVTFAGFRQIDDLPAYYHAAHAFVHPSLKDTWGLVVNEAMAAGLPVAVSRQSGCVPDLVRGGLADRTFDARRASEMTAALLGLHRLSPVERAAWRTEAAARIDRYRPERFAEGLWQACAYPTALASPDPLVRLLFAALRWTARAAEPQRDR